MDSKLSRVSKLMSERGLCSRREADELIKNGQVLVNGQVAQLGQKATHQCIIELAGQGRRWLENKLTVALNKPVGYVSSQAEKSYKSALDLVTPENRFYTRAGSGSKGPKEVRRTGLAPAGRLDIDSTGLLILTQDGAVAKKIINSDSEIEKEYLVRVKGNLSDDGLKLLNHGLSLDGKPLKPAIVRWQNKDQLQFILKEGKKRQIRRMCEAVGLEVVGLKRVRIGCLKLGRLPVGKWRTVHPREILD